MIDFRTAHLFLVGFMGSGKSTVAALLAARMGRTLVDLDAEIEARTGRSIAESLSADTEADFRRTEQEVLGEIPERAAVVATGGGTYLDARIRRRLRLSGVTVWLDVSLVEARRRTADGQGRPLWRNDDPIAFRAFFERRRAVYALADRRVETSRKTPENVSIKVFERFEGFFD